MRLRLRWVVAAIAGLAILSGVTVGITEGLVPALLVLNLGGLTLVGLGMWRSHSMLVNGRTQLRNVSKRLTDPRYSEGSLQWLRELINQSRVQGESSISEAENRILESAVARLDELDSQISGVQKTLQSLVRAHTALMLAGDALPDKREALR